MAWFQRARVGNSEAKTRDPTLVGSLFAKADQFTLVASVSVGKAKGNDFTFESARLFGGRNWPFGRQSRDAKSFRRCAFSRRQRSRTAVRRRLSNLILLPPNHLRCRVLLAFLI